MDIMALTPLKCLPSPPPWLGELENGLHDNLRGVKVGGSDIQLSYKVDWRSLTSPVSYEVTLGKPESTMKE